MDIDNLPILKEKVGLAEVVDRAELVFKRDPKQLSHSNEIAFVLGIYGGNIVIASGAREKDGKLYGDVDVWHNSRSLDAISDYRSLGLHDSD